MFLLFYCKKFIFVYRKLYFLLFLQFIADHIESNEIFRDQRSQDLVMEALKYHLLPERRPLLQSGRTRPRKATVGLLLAVGGMDANKGSKNS